MWKGAMSADAISTPVATMYSLRYERSAAVSVGSLPLPIPAARHISVGIGASPGSTDS